MKTIQSLFLFIIILFSISQSKALVHEKKGWFFFDLGKTLIDSTDYSKMRYLPETIDYLRKLQEHNFHIALIVNIPESWGETETQKISKLKDFVASGWVDEVPFNWDDFDQILIPDSDLHRKPHPFLFNKAINLSKNCPHLYQGENEEEINKAIETGLNSYVVGSNESFFYSIEKFLDENESNWSHCQE